MLDSLFDGWDNLDLEDKKNRIMARQRFIQKLNGELMMADAQYHMDLMDEKEASVKLSQ